jgi:hypothetical protein
VTAAALAGPILAKLAKRPARREEPTLELVGPFIYADIVDHRDNRLVIDDRAVEAAIGRQEAAEE